MRRFRIIPALLINASGLVKSVRFRDLQYVGDPINAVKIFNEKEVDELAILDIDASREGRSPDIARLSGIVSEAFMPIAYGGGISSIRDAETVMASGVEKVIINRSAVENPGLITELAKRCGSQSVMVSIDYKTNLFGKAQVYTGNGSTLVKKHPRDWAKEMELAGAGEIMLNSIARDGTFSGYDLEMIGQVSSAVNIPVIAMGGAGSLEDFKKAIQGGASAAAAGSLFVFQRPHKAVLISYPSASDLAEQVYKPF